MVDGRYPTDAYRPGGRFGLRWALRKVHAGMDQYRWVKDLSASHIAMGIAGDSYQEKDMGRRRRQRTETEDSGYARSSRSRSPRRLTIDPPRAALIGPRMSDGSFFAEKNKKMHYGNIVNMQAGKAAMKSSGKIKLKRGKKVKVSSKLREKIKEVMKGASYSGQYNAIVQGTVGIAQYPGAASAGAEFFCDANAFPSLSDPQMVFCIPRHQNDTQSKWVYWGGFPQKDLSTDQLSYEHMFEHFSPMQYLDAASKLWNNKFGVSQSWFAASPENINLMAKRSDGTISNSSLSTITHNVTGLKLNIVNSHVKYTLRNNSQRTQTIEIFHCTPKIKFPTTSALNDLYHTVQSELFGVTGAGVAATAANANRLSSLMTDKTDATGATITIADCIQHPMFDPKDSLFWSARWKYEKKTIRIAPGETCQHSIQGPKNVLLDFNKIQTASFASNIANTSSSIPVWVKGYNVSVFMRVIPDMTSSADLADNSATYRQTYNNSGNFASIIANCDGRKVVLPICCEVQYSYNIKCPDQQGFLQQAVSAGAVQNLNLKRPVKRFDNFTDFPNTHKLITEENNISPIDQTIYN